MCNNHLKQRGRQRVGKLVHPGYQHHQLCMLRVIFLQVPTPKNNPVHDCKSYLASSQPNHQNPDVQLPSSVGRKEPLAKSAALNNSCPAREFRATLRQKRPLEGILVSPVIFFLCFRARIRTGAMSRRKGGRSSREIY